MCVCLLFAQGEPFGCLLCVVPSLKMGVFCTRVAWVCLLLCKEEDFSPVSTITERRDMGCMRCPCLCI